MSGRDDEADALIHQYLPLAQSLAQQVYRTAPHALELDEMRAIAYLGLVGAAHRWRPYCAERAFSPKALEFFRPFVVRRVRGALIDAIRASDWATRALRSRAKALAEAGQEGRVSHTQLAERTGLTVTEVRTTMRGLAQRPVSLEAEDLDPGAQQDVESSAFTAAVLTAVVALIRSLDRDQQTVVALHYYRGLQLQEVAQVMGLTESRASQLHARAVLAVHEAMRAAATAEPEGAQPP